MKDTININEENEDGAPIHHGQKVKRYLQEKHYIKNHATEIVEKFVACLQQRFIGVYKEDAQPYNEVADDGDNIIFDVLIVNTTI